MGQWLDVAAEMVNGINAFYSFPSGLDLLENPMGFHYAVEFLTLEVFISGFIPSRCSMIPKN